VRRGRIDPIRQQPDRAAHAATGHRRKSAERLAYHLLRVPAPERWRGDAIRDVKEKRALLPDMLQSGGRRPVLDCRDERRQRDLLWRGRAARDLIALEQTGKYHGLYHVALGSDLAPLEGIGPTT